MLECWQGKICCATISFSTKGITMNKPLSIRLPAELEEAFRKHIEDNMLSVSKVVQRLLKDYMESVKVKEVENV